MSDSERALGGALDMGFRWKGMFGGWCGDVGGGEFYSGFLFTAWCLGIDGWANLPSSLEILEGFSMRDMSEMVWKLNLKYCEVSHNSIASESKSF